MNNSTIRIDVSLDENRIPESITWIASDTTAEKGQKAKAMMLSLWDGAEKTALRIDLWTKDMMMDEMSDFFYQTFMTLADTYNRATKQESLVNDMKKFAAEFYNKSRSQQMKQHKT